jgi:hypothetical protein
MNFSLTKICLRNSSLFLFLDVADVLKEHAASIYIVEITAIMIRAILDVMGFGHSKRSL